MDAPIALGGPALASSSAGDALSVCLTGAAEAVARSSRARELREVDQRVDTDGGGGAEGGVNLSNRSCSAPLRGGGDLSNRSDSARARGPRALSDLDDGHNGAHGPDWDQSEEDVTDAVIATGDPMEDISQSVGAGREDDSEEDEGLGASFRRSRRIR